jgi:hypothetical protein
MPDYFIKRQSFSLQLPPKSCRKKERNAESSWKKLENNNRRKE